jgi:hypothetical protein
MPMLLRGANEAEFELALIEDRFPEIQDGVDDSSYVTISIRVGAPEETWEETAPCLNIFELQTLAEWLEAVAAHRPEIGEVDLLEPELNFSIAREGGGEVTLRVRFHLEGRPEEMAVDAPTDRDYIDIRIDREQLRSAAAELRRDLETVAARAHRSQTEPDDDSGILGEPDEDLGIAPPEVAGELDESDDDRMF